MAGFLDRDAPSVDAEYFRYVEKDILGKILFKNFFVNVLNFADEALYIPLGRSPRYDERKIPGDAQVLVQERWLNVEIKCAYKRITHPARRNPLKTWGFARLLRTAKKKSKSPCDLVFAVGLKPGCLGDPSYWHELKQLEEASKANDQVFGLNTAPHEPAFLSCCGFFLFPHDRFPRNNPSVTISRISMSPYGEFFAWGDDIIGCRKKWATVSENLFLKSPTISMTRLRQPNLWPQ